mgnify:CR=1 FL=1
MATSAPPGQWQFSGDLPEVEVRIGAIFWLCRFANSPYKNLARRAATGLAETAGMGARATDDNLIPRWALACQIAFDESEGEDNPVSPSLAVWTGREKDDPDYKLSSARERGDCIPAAEGRALWTCALSKWRGGKKDLSGDMMSFFNETRWIEWQETERRLTGRSDAGTDDSDASQGADPPDEKDVP